MRNMMTTAPTKRSRRLSYANVTSTIALVLALSAGTAYAANEWTGDNIVDGSLYSADLHANSIKSGRIQDGTVQTVDLGQDAVDSSKVADNTLTGADIKEATLAQVPVATLGGLGRSAADESCSPGTVYVRCVEVSLDLQRPARVLLNGRVTAWSQEAGGGTARCRWGGVVQSGPVSLEMAGDHDSDLSLVGLTSVIPAGLGWTFTIECQGGDSGYIYYRDAWITAVAISPN
jgi:hypothetical protein